MRMSYCPFAYSRRNRAGLRAAAARRRHRSGPDTVAIKQRRLIGKAEQYDDLTFIVMKVR